MLLLVVFVLFLILPTLSVWRLSRLPIRGDIHLQMIWRGAVSGLCGGIIGATLSSFIFGIKGYGPIAYLFWLIITMIMGAVFTSLIVIIQKSGMRLNLLGRAALGAFMGIAAAWAWLSLIRWDNNDPITWAVKGIICMIIGSGIVSGILGGPLMKED